MSKKFKILLLEDIPADAELILRVLKRADLISESFVVNCKEDYMKALQEFSPDLILSDHTLPSFTSLEALELAKKKLAKVPFILVTGTMSEEFAVNVMKQGAWDYVPKNELKRLPDAIVHAMEKFDSTKLRQKFLYDLILNEAYMQEAESIANYGSWEVDLVARKLKLSKEAYNIIGHEPGQAETLFENIVSIVHAQDLAHVRQVIKGILNEPGTDVYTEKFRIINTREISTAIKIKFLLKLDLEGRLSRITGSVQDVTDSSALEEQLIDNEARYTCLANSVGAVSIVGLNSDGHVTSLNKEAETLFGYTSQEILTKHISILYAKGEDGDIELDRHFKITNETGTFAAGVCYTTKDGSTLLTHSVITALLNKSGNLFGYMMTMRLIKESIINSRSLVPDAA